MAPLEAPLPGSARRLHFLGALVRNSPPARLGPRCVYFPCPLTYSSGFEGTFDCVPKVLDVGPIGKLHGVGEAFHYSKACRHAAEFRALLEVVKDCTTCNETGAPVFVQCCGCGDLRHLNCIDLPQPFVVEEVVGFKCGTCATTGDDDFISCLTEDTASKMKSSELATSIEKHLIDHDDAPPPPAQGAPKATLLKYVVDNVVGANSPGKRGLVKGRKAAAAAEALQPAAPTSNKRQKSRSTYGTGDR